MSNEERKVLVSVRGLIIINDVIIYDPYYYNAADIEKLTDYKSVRVRRPHWGNFNKEGD